MTGREVARLSAAGIACWGIALSYLDNPHNPPRRATFRSGALRSRTPRRSERRRGAERDFIDALLVFYTDYDKSPHTARVQLYLKAIETVARRYPDDDEAQLFYAITLNVAASPNDKTYSNQLKGTALLEKVFQRRPRHPGVAHYLIHLYDTPALAERGPDKRPTCRVAQLSRLGPKAIIHAAAET